MDQDQNFDPFINWSEITDEMVRDLHERLVPYREATDRFLKSPNKQDAIMILQGQQDLTAVTEAIIHTLLTVPAMVHVAGPRSNEACESEAHDHDHHIIQRCARCGSILQVWHEGMRAMTGRGVVEVSEDDVSWWEEGARVAKSTHDSGGAMYLVPNDDELSDYEKMCPDLAGELSG